MTCYLVGGYIRLYMSMKLNNYKVGLIGTVGSLVLMIASVIVVDFVGSKFGFTGWSYMMSDSNRILAVTCSVSSFILFSNIHVKQNRLINTISGATFGVLLFHANGWPIRNFLWITLFRNAKFYNSSILAIRSIAVVLLVFLFGVVIELIRKNFIEKPILNWIYERKTFLRLEEKFKCS